jgi:predicted nuclease with TOPRIM domain
MSSLITQITERVASLEASLRALESDRARLQSENRELQEALDQSRQQAEDLRQRCGSLEREAAETDQLVAESRAETERWRHAHAQLREQLRAIVEKSTADSEESRAAPSGAETVPAQESNTGERLWQASQAPQTWEIVASPFDRFAELRVFQEAIRGLDGTRDVRLLHFDKGIVELSVDYEGAVPLQQAIGSLEEFPGVVTQDSNGRLVYRRGTTDEGST